MVKSNVGLLFSMLYQSPWSNSGWGNSSPWSNVSTPSKPSLGNAWNDTGVGTWRDSPTWKDAVVWTNAPWSNQAPDVISPTWRNTGTTTPTLPIWANAPGVVPVPTWMDTSKPVVQPSPVVEPPIVSPPVIAPPIVPLFPITYPVITVPSTPATPPAPGKMQPPALTVPGGGSGYTPVVKTPSGGYIPTKSTLDSVLSSIGFNRSVEPPTKTVEMGMGSGFINSLIDFSRNVPQTVGLGAISVVPRLVNLFSPSKPEASPEQVSKVQDYMSKKDLTGTSPSGLMDILKPVYDRMGINRTPELSIGRESDIRNATKYPKAVGMFGTFNGTEKAVISENLTPIGGIQVAGHEIGHGIANKTLPFGNFNKSGRLVEEASATKSSYEVVDGFNKFYGTNIPHKTESKFTEMLDAVGSAALFPFSYLPKVKEIISSESPYFFSSLTAQLPYKQEYKPDVVAPNQLGFGSGLVDKVKSIFGGETSAKTTQLPSIESVTGVPSFKSIIPTRPMTPDEISQYNKDVIATQSERYKDYPTLQKFVEYSKMPGELINVYASRSTILGKPLAGKDLINIPKSLTGWESDWKVTVPTQKQAEEAFTAKRAGVIQEFQEIAGRKSDVSKYAGLVGFGLETAPAQVGIAMVGGQLLGKAVPMVGSLSRIGAAKYAGKLASAEGGIGLGVAKAASKYVVTPAATYAEPLLNLAGAGYVGYEVKKTGTTESGITIGTGIYEGVKLGAAYGGFKKTYEPTMKSLKGIEDVSALAKTTKPLSVVESSLTGKSKFTGESPSDMFGTPIARPSGKSLTAIDKEIAGQSRFTGGAPSNYPKPTGRFGFMDVFGGKPSGKITYAPKAGFQASEYGYGNRIIENPFEGFGDVVGRTVVGVGKGVGGISELGMPAFGTGMLREYMGSEIKVRDLNVFKPEYGRPAIDKYGSFTGGREVGVTAPIYSGTEVGNNIFGGMQYGGRTGNDNRNQNGNPFINPGKQPNIYPTPNKDENPFITPGEDTFFNPNINPVETPVKNIFEPVTPTINDNPFVNREENRVIYPNIFENRYGGFPPQFRFVTPLGGSPGGFGGGGGSQPSFRGGSKVNPISYTVLGRQVQEAPRRIKVSSRQGRGITNIGQQVLNEAMGKGSKNGSRRGRKGKR